MKCMAWTHLVTFCMNGTNYQVTNSNGKRQPKYINSRWTMWMMVMKHVLQQLTGHSILTRIRLTTCACFTKISTENGYDRNESKTRIRLAKLCQYRSCSNNKFIQVSNNPHCELHWNQTRIRVCFLTLCLVHLFGEIRYVRYLRWNTVC